MELPAAGEHVFAVESIEKKRSRKVCHKDIFTHMHMERSILFSPDVVFCRSPIKWFLRWRCIAECILLRKVTLRSLCRFSPFTGEGWVSGQVARMVPKVSPLLQHNSNTHDDNTTFKTEVCVCVNVFIRASVGAQMGGCAFLLWALDALAPMMNVVLRCMQSPVCQLKEDVSIIEPYI